MLKTCSKFIPRLAVAMILRTGPESLVHFGIKCSSWCQVNIGTSFRSICTSLGDDAKISVEEGNLMCTRTFDAFIGIQALGQGSTRGLSLRDMSCKVYIPGPLYAQRLNEVMKFSRSCISQPDAKPSPRFGQVSMQLYRHSGTIERREK